MARFAPNVDAYLRRIGFSGPVSVSTESLREIQRCHPLAIPFENLDVIASRGIALDGPSLERKLIGERRGGYCFEQNGYLLSVLREAGFRVRPFLARVCWNLPEGVRPPRTHLALAVEVDGQTLLFDVGFGGVGISDTLNLEIESEQKTRDGLRRILRRGQIRVLQANRNGAWASLYEIAPDEAEPPDWEAANWYTSTHPQSRFRQNLIVARARPDGRSSLLNRELALRRGASEPERQVIGDPEELLAALRSHFDLSFPSGTRFGPPGSLWPA